MRLVIVTVDQAVFAYMYSGLINVLHRYIVILEFYFLILEVLECLIW